MQSTNSFFKGRVLFQADFSGIEFNSIEVSPPFEGVARAIIGSSSSEGVSLEVGISNADTFDGATAKAEEVAKYLAKIVTFKFGVFQKEFRCVSNSLSEEETLPDGNTKSTAWCVIRDSSYGIDFESWAILGEKQIEDLKEFVEKNNHDSFPSYDLFYSALGLTDPIAKFMVLYLIVLSIFTDDQWKVDEFILSKESGESGVPTFPPHRPRKSGVPETIYTKLRNQVGHVRPGTTIQSTREEMEKNLGGLIRITRKIISLQP